MEEEEVQVIRAGNNYFRLLKRPDGTYRSEPLPSPSPGIPLIPKERKILGIFDSSSSPGDKHYVIANIQGTSIEIYCTCRGFKSPNSCWHYRGMIEVLKTTPIHTITEPLKIKL